MNLKWNVNGINFENSFLWSATIEPNGRLDEWAAERRTIVTQASPIKSRTNPKKERKARAVFVAFWEMKETRQPTTTTTTLHNGQRKDSVSLVKKPLHSLHFKWRNTSSQMHRIKTSSSIQFNSKSAGMHNLVRCSLSYDLRENCVCAKIISLCF